MCTIIGAALTKANWKDIMLLHNILLESRIRGLHATGVSYLEGGVIQTIKEPMGAAEFLKHYSFADFVDDDGSLRLIAHCRYSTSDLEFNQPIANSQLALVHNGVISQELPENWEGLYGFKCDTKNDTELLFKTVEAQIGYTEKGDDPLACWPDSSVAAIELYNSGYLRAYRNGRRPLYWAWYESKGFLIVSTADILIRAKADVMIHRMPHDIYHLIKDDFSIAKIGSKHATQELQP